MLAPTVPKPKTELKNWAKLERSIRLVRIKSSLWQAEYMLKIIDEIDSLLGKDALPETVSFIEERISEVETLINSKEISETEIDYLSKDLESMRFWVLCLTSKKAVKNIW